MYNYIDMSYCNYGLTELIFHLSNEFSWTLILSLYESLYGFEKRMYIDALHIIDILNELNFIQ